MSFVVALSLVGIAVVQTNAPASPDTAAMAAPAPASEQPARDWLTLIDDGGFDESYEAAGAPLRDQYAPGLWKFGLTLRMTKGKLESRTLANVAQTGEFEGRKGSEFEILTFNSLFQYNNAQIERVVMERVEGEWKVVSYEITDPEKAAD